MANFEIARSRWLAGVTFVALWPAWVRQVKFGLAGFPIGLCIFAALLGWWVIAQRRTDSKEAATKGFLWAAWLLLIAYAVASHRVPPLGGQVLATLILACSLLSCFPRAAARERVAILALLPFSLPLEMALQFVFGFPFRSVSAVIAGALLSPYGVTVQGTTLWYGTHALEVDAACSGILGLWAFMIVGGLLSLMLRHRWPQLLLTLTTAAVTSIAYNVLRTSLLFMYRFHEGAETVGMHTFLGSLAFALAACLFVATTYRWLGGRDHSPARKIPA